MTKRKVLVEWRSWLFPPVIMFVSQSTDKIEVVILSGVTPKPADLENKQSRTVLSVNLT